MSNNAKIVVLRDIVLPNDPTVGAGVTRQFQMSSPVCFTGKRLVIDAQDAVTGEYRPLLIRQISHDNKQLLANAADAIFNASIFPPNIIFFAGGVLGFQSANVSFSEKFDVADNFSITLANPFVNGVNVSIYWVTSYGTSCQKCG